MEKPSIPPQPPPLPADLPRPEDDGAAAHLPGTQMPEVVLRATRGDDVNLAEPAEFFRQSRCGPAVKMSLIQQNTSEPEGGLMRRLISPGWKMLLTALAVSILLAACGGDDDQEGTDDAADRPEAEPVVLTISTQEFEFDAPESVPAGLVEITVSNEGEEPHEVQLMKLHDGVTFDEFFSASKKDRSGLDSLELADAVGGAGSTAGIPPGETTTVLNELEPGSYAMVCLVQGHNSEGMIAPLEVTEAEGAVAAPPETEGEISLSDYQFILPADFSGNGTFEFVNNGPDFHEAAVYKIDATLDKLQKYLDSPKAFRADPPGGEPEPVGGVGGIEPAASAYAEFDLPSGTYVMVCFFPTEEGAPHAAEGMYTAFEVQ
jgi:uncharacterized cupredoxin-like copper-binding protein